MEDDLEMFKVEYLYSSLNHRFQFSYICYWSYSLKLSLDDQTILYKLL